MHSEFASIRQQVRETFNRVSLRPHVRQTVKFLLDTGLAATGWVAAGSLVQGALPQVQSILSWATFAMAVNLAFRHTRQHYRQVGLLEFRSLILSMIVMILAAYVGYLGDRVLSLNLGVHDPNVTLAASLITAVSWALARAAVVDFFRHRFLRKHPHRPTVDRRKARRSGTSSANELALRTLIIGAGQAGAKLCHELRSNPNLKSRVVGFIDDALEKQGLRIQGVPVLGPTMLLPALIKEAKASQVILAMPSISGSRIRELAKILHMEGVRVKTLPSMQSFLGKNIWKLELRDISIDDLLRRDPIQLDLGSIRHVLADSVVLITGAGGSIGSELARQVANFTPSHLILLGRGENSLWGVERDLRRLFPEVAIEVELCDIRNQNRLQHIFETWRPRFVFHAAAHKHVPYLEKHPEEAIENNILGTLNVVQAAQSVGTEKFVNISTDKAVNPTSVLGVSKRIAEFLVMQAAEDEQPDGRYVSVRFGNVLGSRGSVIPLFHEQISRGGPLTVTHPDMTRYFMTIPEASQLVLQAGLLGRSGKVFVLDMGEPVRIVDLATDMARLSGLTPGYDIDIQFTGIRPGEKLYEELFADQEQRHSDVHPKLFEAIPEPMSRPVMDRVIRSLGEALSLPEGLRQQAILNGFMELVPTYAPSPTGFGKHFSGPHLAAESQEPMQLTVPKIVILRPTIPLAQTLP